MPPCVVGATMCSGLLMLGTKLGRFQTIKNVHFSWGRQSANMKTAIAILIILSIASFASADDLNVRTLLKRDLADSIEIYSNKEIWYCPDNTCEIYSASEAHSDFTAYVYMHLFHQSSYNYLDLSFGEVKAFRSTAVEEPEIRKSLALYCPDNSNEPACISNGMQEKLGISTCFGRYDEGGFWGCDQFRERAVTRC